jgi:hypothetical protein
MSGTVPGIVHMADMVDDTAEVRSLRALLGFVLFVTIVGGGIDLYFDAPESWWSAHVLFELTLIAAAVVMSIVLWRGWWRSRQTLVETQQVLASFAAERAAWRTSAEQALASFSQAVDGRFAVWQLTPAERDVALRLLKGHSHK